MVGLILFIFLLVLIVSIGWIYFFWKLDKHDKEPLSSLIICFILGGISTIPASVINELGIKVFGLRWEDFFEEPFSKSILIFLYLVLVVGINEEVMKFLPVYLYAFRTKHFNEPMDGLVYASASAAGFLFVEDIEYITAGFQAGFLEGMYMTFVRIITSPVHILFASYWGIELGLYKKDPSRLQKLVLAIGLAAFMHGLYDFFALNNFIIGIVILIVLIVIMLIRRIRFLNRISSFNPVNYLIGCIYCDFKLKSNAHFCPNCGKETDWVEKTETLKLKYFCGKCKSNIYIGQKFCSECGNRIKWEG